MNKIFISGMVLDVPAMKTEQGDIPHLTLNLSVRHKVKSGEFRKEVYRVSAWYNTAKWGAEHLNKGHVIGIEGYLTQRQVSIGNITMGVPEIVVEEFLPMQRVQRETPENSEIVC